MREVDREDRALGAEAGARAAGLDLDEDEGAAVEGDDVELAVAGAGVALDDLPAGRREAGGDQLLGAAADPLAGVGHRRDAKAVGARRAAVAPLVARSCTRFFDICAPRVAICLPSVVAVLATARTFTLDGISARPVRVEVDVHRGLPAFSVVGLPDAAVREARERVRAALVNCGFEFPLRRIVANLAPASLRKAGPGMDLAIAAALLTASGQLELGGAAAGGDGRRAGPRRLGRGRSTARWRSPRRRARAARRRSSSRPRTAPRRRWSTGSR